MKKIVCLFCCVCFLFACNQPVPGENDKDDPNGEGEYILSEEYDIDYTRNKIGKFVKAYEGAAKNGGSSNILSKYYNGQIVPSKYGYDQVKFHAEISEYDSFSDDITSYVDTLSQSNSLFHQNYDVNWKADKRYVEIATYSEVDTDLIIAVEVRICPTGNWWDLYEKEGWCCKAVIFTPDFKIDLGAQKYVATGEPIGGYVRGEVKPYNSSNTSVHGKLDYDYDLDVLSMTAVGFDSAPSIFAPLHESELKVFSSADQNLNGKTEGYKDTDLQTDLVLKSKFVICKTNWLNRGLMRRFEDKELKDMGRRPYDSLPESVEPDETCLEIRQTSIKDTGVIVNYQIRLLENTASSTKGKMLNLLSDLRIDLDTGEIVRR